MRKEKKKIFCKEKKNFVHERLHIKLLNCKSTRGAKKKLRKKMSNESFVKLRHY